MWPNVQLRHAGPNDVNREAELKTPSRVACSDLILPSKPSVKYVSIWATGGECYEHSPHNQTYNPGSRDPITNDQP